MFVLLHLLGSGRPWRANHLPSHLTRLDIRPMAGFLLVILKKGLWRPQPKGQRRHVIRGTHFSAFGEKCRVDYKSVIDAGMIEILCGGCQSTLRSSRRRPYR
jgi:hypothetical protein